MSKATKWAVETAKTEMSAAIRVKMAEWDKTNPAKAREFSMAEIAEIAGKDPAWQSHVVARAKRGYSNIDIRRSDFEGNSPMVAAAIKKTDAVDATRNKARVEVEEKLIARRDEIIRTAIIADCEANDLLTNVNNFCRL